MVTAIIDMFKAIYPAYEALYKGLNNTVIDLIPDTIGDIVRNLIGFTGGLPIVGGLLSGLQTFVWDTPLYQVIFTGLFAFLAYQLVIWILNIIT